MPATKGPKQPNKAEKKQQKARREKEVATESQQKQVEGDEPGDDEGCGGGSSNGGLEGNGSSGGTEPMCHCVDCGKKILVTQTCVQCDGCGFWHHTSCEKVQEDIFSFLSDHNGEPSLLWYCRKCIATGKKLTTMMLMMQEQQSHIEEKVNDLARNMQQKLDNVVKELNRKLDEKESEKKSVGAESQRRVEEKFDVLIDTVKQKMEGNSSVGEVVNGVGEVVITKLKEDNEEMEEIRQRRMNVILHGLKESMDVDVDRRRQQDESELMNMLHGIDCDDVSVSATIRLGKRQTDPVKNPRAMKIVVASEEQRDKILRKAKNLRDKAVQGWDRIFIHQDLTPKQRERRQNLVREKKQRETNGEKDLIIVNDRIVTRRPRKVTG